MEKESKAKEVVFNNLGKSVVENLDEPVRDYIIGILGGFNPADGDLWDSLGGLLEDAVGGNEEELKKICEAMENEMFGDEKEAAKDAHQLRLLDNPIRMSKEEKEIEATISLFVYVPSISRGARARGEVGNDKSAKDRRRKERREERRAKQRAANRQQRKEKPLKRDPVVFRRRAMFEDSSRSRDLNLQNVDVSVSGKSLISDASLTLAFGRRYGLVGRNGAGKTTLLRCIAGRELNGIPLSIHILHVEQETVGDETTVLDSVLQADIERHELLLEEKELLGQKGEASGIRLAEVYARLQEIDADSAVARASSILAGLGFSPEDQRRPTKEFSGGWRMRMALSRALFCQPDILLLDEPTNMLDISAVLWLEDYLQNSWENTILVVSHDRNFLNHVATDVIHLSPERTLVPYHGNYDSFEKTRMERLKNTQKAIESQERLRAHTQKFIDKFRFNAKRASLVQSRIKMLKKMQSIPALIEESVCTFTFPEPEPLNPPLIACNDVTFFYDPGRVLFEKINFALDMDSRVALVGANGMGKTTLLKLITDQLAPKAGTLTVNRRIRFATFSQHHVDQLDMELSALEFFKQNWPNEKDYRAHLGRYGISGELALQPIHTLSGGQKSRVVFALMGWIKPHFLILDEPTNHLDVETVDVLSLALNSFSGGIVLVSHDERLITSVCNELWVVGNGAVVPFDGDFDEYKKTVMKEFL